MILVGDVLNNVFNKQMMMTSSIVLMLLVVLVSESQAADPPIPDVAKWTINGPIKSIQGTYRYKSEILDDHPPTLASLWDVGSTDFSLVVWPPKYCAAVHVYFINSEFKGVGNFHVVPKMITDSPFVKFYPPIGEVEIRESATGPIDKLFNQRSSIYFQHVTASTFEVELASGHQYKFKNFDTSNPTKKVTMDLTKKTALILTNSRFCFAHILKDGQNGPYHQLLNTDEYQDQAKLPDGFLTKFSAVQGFKSLFIPPIPDTSTKKIDLLPVLRNPDFHDITKMRQKPNCNGFITNSRNPLEKAVGQISVDSWVGQMNKAKALEREEQFFIHVGECSWIRLWISPGPGRAKMDEYDTKMQLGDTIDIFFDQQFFVGPDSDEARPLSGNSRQIDTIMIRRHWDGNGAPNPSVGKRRVVQMSYGRGAGPSLGHTEYFHMPVLHSNDYRINLIKAANCEANIVTKSTRTSSANRPRPNGIRLTECERSLLKNTNKDEVADDKNA